MHPEPAEAIRPAGEHIPVLAHPLAEHVHVPPNGIIVDVTVGQGGHSHLLGSRLDTRGVIVGLDIDEKALRNSRSKLKDLRCKIRLAHANFAETGSCLQRMGVDKADLILADLGYSSAQLMDPELGISFQSDMPLDMRIDRSLKVTAADIVNKTVEKKLADLIFEYGQDRASRRIARFIVHHRRQEPIRTTKQLAAIVSKALYRSGAGRRTRLHPATRTFQALRIVVNSELANLRHLLMAAPPLLKPGGTLAIISFHSLEDRMVKLDFKENAKVGIYQILTKKPIVPTKDEIGHNRRARSAKLRLARRL
ncbi:MAG: 16S rRNA (cytosine(1402)-N(4))-methyltransferase RsmH [Planctomycetes bacterium]|nr:16S rRNA (cytosine(1402)-N(4))-methyltransferase RsmH [Planctomycetota bacterium]